MKNKCLIWLVITACLCGFLASGQSAKRSRRSSADKNRNLPAIYVPTDMISVDVSIKRAPEYVVEGKKTRIGAGVPDAARQWLVSEISFGVALRKGRSSRTVLLPGVKVELYLFIPGTGRDGRSYRWFYGRQQLHCLVLEPGQQRSRRFWASLLLPSQFVFLHIPQERGGYTIHALEGVVLILDRENNLLGRQAFGNKTKLSAKREKTLFEAVDDIRKNGSDCIDLWPREKTPWAWLEASRFELPLTKLSDNESAGRPQPSKADEPEDKE